MYCSTCPTVRSKFETMPETSLYPDLSAGPQLCSTKSLPSNNNLRSELLLPLEVSLSSGRTDYKVKRDQVSVLVRKSNRNEAFKKRSVPLRSHVPFIRVSEDQTQKERIKESTVTDATMRVFFPTREARDEAADILRDLVEMMMFYVQDAKQVFSNPEASPQEQIEAMMHLQWDGVDANHDVVNIDDYPDVFGIEITERVFWEGFVMMQDCSRPKSTCDTGRITSPTSHQDMNFKALRLVPMSPDEPMLVIMQTDADYPMSPRSLMMAYDEGGRIYPVMSNMDTMQFSYEKKALVTA